MCVSVYVSEFLFFRVCVFVCMCKMSAYVILASFILSLLSNNVQEM